MGANQSCDNTTGDASGGSKPIPKVLDSYQDLLCQVECCCNGKQTTQIKAWRQTRDNPADSLKRPAPTSPSLSHDDCLRFVHASSSTLITASPSPRKLARSPSRTVSDSDVTKKKELKERQSQQDSDWASSFQSSPSSELIALWCKKNKPKKDSQGQKLMKTKKDLHLLLEGGGEREKQVFDEVHELNRLSSRLSHRHAASKSESNDNLGFF